MKQLSLLEMLQEYTCSSALAMHMPGHKRNTALAPYLEALGAGLDITEISGFSNLHDPEGLIHDKMQEAARLWGSRQAWWLIGGSTAGILSAIDAATTPGDTVLIARNCHKSVFHACELRQLRPIYLQPDCYKNQAFPDKIRPNQVEELLEAHPDTRLVVLTSPTYEGLISDIAAIGEIVHEHGAILMVDEAHGAHLGLSDAFPPSAITQGADIVVQSLHKTLPSLTQTAMLHLCSDRVDADELGFRLSVYQTSSPSYLLMASIDGCVNLLKTHGRELCATWRQNLEDFALRVQGLSKLSLPLQGDSCAEPSKLLISTAGTSLSGPALAEALRSRFSIEVEMCTGDTVLAMTGLGDTPEALHRLARALLTLDGEISAGPPPEYAPLPIPEKRLEMFEASRLPTEFVPIEDCAGRIAGDYLWAYPPGIPLVVPGEIISANLITYIHRCNAQTVDLHSPKLVPDRHLRVVKTP